MTYSAYDERESLVRGGGRGPVESGDAEQQDEEPGREQPGPDSPVPRSPDT